MIILMRGCMQQSWYNVLHDQKLICAGVLPDLVNFRSTQRLRLAEYKVFTCPGTASILEAMQEARVT